MFFLECISKKSEKKIFERDPLESIKNPFIAGNIQILQSDSLSAMSHVSNPVWANYAVSKETLFSTINNENPPANIRSPPKNISPARECVSRYKQIKGIPMGSYHSRQINTMWISFQNVKFYKKKILNW